MGVYISVMEMPKSLVESITIYPDGRVISFDGKDRSGIVVWHAVEVKAPHGRLGDLNALRTRMYHEAFETDSDMQKWENGCWIRYRMFERMEEAAPTVLEAEGKDDA